MVPALPEGPAEVRERMVGARPRAHLRVPACGKDGGQCRIAEVPVPTEVKRQIVAELAEVMGRITMAIATDPTNQSVNRLTELRRRLREGGAEYRVVKNRLALLAARAAGVGEAFDELLSGSTGLVLGYGDPAATARVLDEFIRQTRSDMVVRHAFMGGALLDAADVSRLASLPPREVIVAQLMGQLQAPVTQLASVLVGPVRGLAIVLQRRSEQLGGA